MNSETQLLALDLTDYIVDSCNISLHSQVGSKEFIGKLISLLKTRDNPKVQLKILKIIKKWGEKFSSMKDIVPNFSLTYNNLKNSGIEFPSDTKNDYAIYLEEKGRNISSNNNGNVKSSNNQISTSNLNNNQYKEKDRKEREKSQNFNYNNNDYDGIIETEYVENDIVKLEPSDFKKKYRRFVEELNVLIENVHLANQMIDYSQIGKKPDDSLRMIMLNLKGCEDNLLKAINGQISDELLLEICLKVNDDMNITTERYNLLKAGVKPLVFKSSFSNTSSNKVKKKVEKVEKIEKNTSKQENKNDIEVKPVTNDIFDIFNNNDSKSNTNNNNNNYNNNVNNNMQENQNKSNQIDLNDIINSFSNTNLNNQSNTNTVPLFNFTDQKINNNSSSNNNSNKIDNLINTYGTVQVNNNMNNNNNFNNMNNLNNIGNNIGNNMGNNMNNFNNFNNLGNNMNNLNNQGNFNQNNQFGNNMGFQGGQFNNYPMNNQGFNLNQNNQGIGMNMNNNNNMNNMNTNNMNMYNNLNYNNNLNMNNNNRPYINTNPNLAIGGIGDNSVKQLDSKDMFDLGLKPKKDKLEGINPFS